MTLGTPPHMPRESVHREFASLCDDLGCSYVIAFDWGAEGAGRASNDGEHFHAIVWALPEARANVSNATRRTDTTTRAKHGYHDRGRSTTSEHYERTTLRVPRSPRPSGHYLSTVTPSSTTMPATDALVPWA
jgi:hypothetical protein